MKRKDMINPLKALGFDLDIKNKKVQERINNYVTENSKYNLEGYRYKLYNAYSKNSKNKEKLEIQIARYDGKNLSDSVEEKFNRTLIHHANKCFWNCCIVKKMHKENKYEVMPCKQDSKRFAVVNFLNADLKPYLAKDTYVFAQINCIGYDVKIFSGSEKSVYTDNNFKICEKDKKERFLDDNTILMENPSSKEEQDLNYVRGKIIKIQKISQEFLGIQSTYFMATIETEFGKTPILFIEENISYSSNNKIKKGNVIEALVLTTGDIMIYPNVYPKVRYDKVSIYEIFRKALETEDYDLLDKIMDNNCVYISKENKKYGKKEIIDFLHNTYKKGNYLTEYAEVIENPAENYNLEDEVLCISTNKNICGIFKLEINKNNYIEHIYFSNEPETIFMMYNPYNSGIIDKKRREIQGKVIKILNERKFSEINIQGIMLEDEDYFYPHKMLKWLNQNKNEKITMEDILTKEDEIRKEYRNNHPIKNYIEQPSHHKVKVEHREFNNYIWREGNKTHEVLNIVPDYSMYGRYLILSSTEGVFSININLSYCKLDGLKNNNMYEQYKINLYDFGKEDYEYTKALKNLLKCIKLYKTIRLWSNHKSEHKFIFPYFIIYSFKDILKEKNVEMVYEDEIKGRNDLSELLTGEIYSLLETKIDLTDKDIDYYSNEWDKVLKKNSDIRIIKDDKIINISFDELDKKIIDIVKEHKKGIKRIKLMLEFYEKGITNDMNTELYSYLIDRMIEKNLLKTDNSKETTGDSNIKNDLIYVE